MLKRIPRNKPLDIPYYKTKRGKIYNNDNLEILKGMSSNTVDSCISDFPYDLSFMGKSWDTVKNFYDWNLLRANELFRVLKPGGYCAIFGHPKTNHRMKCAFEDAGFNIVEEIDWVYLTGLPKNQDIEKLFNKANNSILATKWSGWKTSGLKPCHEPITIFQKPLDKNYCNNLEKYNCGAMNIDACRVEMSQEDRKLLNAKASKNPNSKYSEKDTRIYGKYEKNRATKPNDLGRFPSNVVLDEYVAQLFDLETESENSKVLTIIKYCQKPTNKEKTLHDGSKNSHATVKPIELIKWLIKLLTPKNGLTIDITSGSCTHGVACELLNNEEEYKLNWINVEQLNTIEEPYCEIGKNRLIESR